MVVCAIVYILLIGMWILKRKHIIQNVPRYIFLILFVCNTIALGLFVMEGSGKKLFVIRNSYGEGSKVEEFEVVIPGENTTETIQMEIAEQEYKSEEIQEMFENVMKELDEIVLGENKSFDRVEQDLDLVGNIADYPVEIVWELDSYLVMNVEGKIRGEHVTEEGTLVEIRGTITYLDEQAIYVRHAMVYPMTRKGVDKILYEIEMALREKERETRKEEKFTLPEEVAGNRLEWSQKTEGHGYYVIFIGIMLAIFLIYKRKEDDKKKKIVREDELRREYPEMISKLTMLLGTGMTVKHAWKKIVESYEQQKERLGTKIVYEEMGTTLHEMKGGISEGEAYERFGKRCEIAMYLKFGALLSQNLRKGSRGLSELLRMEAIQSFENRKNQAKQAGEEAGTKLLIPMMGMLAVVMIMVMVPAFLTMQ